MPDNPNRTALGRLLSDLTVAQTIEDTEAALDGRADVASPGAVERLTERLDAMLEAEEAPIVTAADGQQVLHEGLSFLRVTLASLAGPAVAAYRLSALPQSADPLYWTPSAARVRKDGKLVLRFQCQGPAEAIPSEMSITCREATLEPLRTRLESKILTVTLPDPGLPVGVLEVAAPTPDRLHIILS